MMRGELIFPSVIFALIAAFAAGGYVLGEYAWSVIAFPLGAAALGCSLCAIEIARAMGRRAAVAGPAAPGDEAGGTAQMSGPGLFWMFVLPVFLYALGFVAGPAAYLLACLRANGFSWTLSAAVAAASVAVTWGFFVHVMGVLLPLMPLWWP